MPPPLDINLHVKYIQNLDQVRPLLFSALSPPETADEIEKRPGVPSYRTFTDKWGLLGSYCIMYHGSEGGIIS